MRERKRKPEKLGEALASFLAESGLADRCAELAVVRRVLGHPRAARAPEQRTILRQRWLPDRDARLRGGAGARRLAHGRVAVRERHAVALQRDQVCARRE